MPSHSTLEVTENAFITCSNCLIKTGHVPVSQVHFRKTDLLRLDFLNLVALEFNARCTIPLNMDIGTFDSGAFLNGIPPRIVADSTEPEFSVPWINTWSGVFLLTFSLTAALH